MKKTEIIKDVSNKYAIFKQVYNDRVLIRTNNLIYSKKFDAYMFILTNNSCLWLKPFNVADIVFGKTQYETTEGKLIEVTPENFKYIKTYDKNFENFSINKQNEIKNYEDVLKLAQEQENENVVCRFSQF